MWTNGEDGTMGKFWNSHMVLSLPHVHMHLLSLIKKDICDRLEISSFFWQEFPLSFPFFFIICTLILSFPCENNICLFLWDIDIPIHSYRVLIKRNRKTSKIYIYYYIISQTYLLIYLSPEIISEVWKCLNVIKNYHIKTFKICLNSYVFYHIIGWELTVEIYNVIFSL